MACGGEGVLNSAVSGSRLLRFAEVLRERLRAEVEGEHCIAGGSCWMVVRDFLGEELGIEVRAVEVPVESWLVTGGVEPGASWVLAPPLQVSSEVEGEPLVLGGDPSEPGEWRGVDASGRVVIAPFPRVPDDLKATALLAWEAGAAALLLESEEPRVIVGAGSWGYSYWSGAPLPLPVLVVPRGYSSIALRSGVVSVWVKGGAETRRDYILVSFEGEPRVVFGAHHDSWFLGFNDNVLGIVQAAIAHSEAVKRLPGSGLVLFAAEEHGAPGAAAWYWAWGSRYYSRLLAESLGYNVLYVNFDVAGLDCLAASGSPQYAWAPLGLGLRHRPWECPECDSMSLATTGFPTVSIHSLWCEETLKIYHTPRDSPGAASPHAAALAVEAGLKAATAGPLWGELEAMLKSVLGTGPALARQVLHVISRAAARAGWSSVYPELARRFLKPVHMGSYRFETGDLEAQWFPSISAYKRVSDGMHSEAIIAGEERPLYTAGYAPGANRSPHKSLKLQLEANLRRDLEEALDLARQVIA